MSDCNLRRSQLSAIKRYEISPKCTWSESLRRHEKRILQKHQNRMDDVDYRIRKDITYLNTYAIDRTKTNLVDDAFSYDMKSRRIYMHAADPTAFFHERIKDPIVEEAFRRQMQMEVAENVVSNIFPMEISKELLSLDAKRFKNKKVPALTVTFRIRHDGSIRSSSIKIFAALIKPPERFTHEEANRHIKNGNFTEWQSLLKKIKIMNRYRRGECHKQHHDNNYPKCKLIKVNDMKADGMIEELSVAANTAVGKYAREKDLEMIFCKMHPRREVKLSRYHDKHALMGVDVFARVTSPLVMSENLINHFLLKAALRRETPPIEGSALEKRIRYIRSNTKNYEQFQKHRKKKTTSCSIKR